MPRFNYENLGGIIHFEYVTIPLDKNELRAAQAAIDNMTGLEAGMPVFDGSATGAEQAEWYMSFPRLVRHSEFHTLLSFGYDAARELVHQLTETEIEVVDTAENPRRITIDCDLKDAADRLAEVIRRAVPSDYMNPTGKCDTKKPA